MTKVGIVVPILNNFDGFADMAASIKTKHEYRLYIQQQYRIQVPLAAAWNKGSRDAFADGCDYALVCNDDIIFAPDCIDAMIREYERLRDSEKVIMVTPTNHFAAFQENRWGIMDYHLPDDHETTIADHPNFSCFLITPEYFDVVGSFDEKFNPAWFEDNDSHRRAKLAGFREICTTAAPMVHVGGVTTSRIPSPHSGDSEKHYIEKWGGLPERESYHTPYNNPDMTWRDW